MEADSVVVAIPRFCGNRLFETVVIRTASSGARCYFCAECDEAASVFLDALALTVYDESSSQDEERWFTLGFDARGRLLAVAHTYQIAGTTSARIRIISARKATKRERNYYENQTDQVKP